MTKSAPESPTLLSRSFELVYYDPLRKFDGRTHFNHGPESALSTKQRVDYLHAYAAALKQLFGLKKDSLAFPVVSDAECETTTDRIKPCPLPQVRSVIPLKYWRWKLVDTENAAPPGRKWLQPGYDDNCWCELEAPTLINKNKPLLLRAEFLSGPSGRTVLDIESIIGKFRCWVNGRLACRVDNFAPIKIDISQLVRPCEMNCVTIRVEKAEGEQVGIAGKIAVECTGKVFAEDLFVATREIRRSQAKVDVQLTFRNLRKNRFEGDCQLSFFEWFPRERQKAAFSTALPVSLGGGESKQLLAKCLIKQPHLWTPELPRLYKVRAVISERNGKAVDDLVRTCGIRTIEQKNGKIYFNSKEFFIRSFGNNLGFPPSSDFHGAICPEDSWLVRDMLLCKRAGANAMRVHPWGYTGEPGKYSEYGWPLWGKASDATNYERIAEIADQLGLCLFWVTRCWTLWDLKDYHGQGKRYEQLLTSSIKRVRNHASIIIYEGLNEVGLCSKKPVLNRTLNRFYKRYVKIVNAIDNTRLLVPDCPWGPWHIAKGCCDEPTLMTPNTFWSIHNYIGWYRDLEVMYLLRDEAWPEDKRRPFLLAECGAEAMPDWSKYKGLPWYGIWLNNGRSCGQRETERLGRPLRILKDSEAEVSQAYQALCLQQTANYLRRSGADGMSINLIADGLAEGNYHKGVTDLCRKAKLGFFGAKMSYQEILVTGMDGDFLLSKNDLLKLALINDGERLLPPVQIQIEVFDRKGKLVDEHSIEAGPIETRVNELGQYKPKFPEKGLYRIEYRVIQKRGRR